MVKTSRFLTLNCFTFANLNLAINDLLRSL